VRALLTCFSFAYEDEKLMEWLIEQGADFNAVSDLDEPVLSVAIAAGSIGIPRLLLARGPGITHGNLLHCAAERKDQHEGAELARFFLQKGADVHAHRCNNPIARRQRAMSRLATPLHEACYAQNIRVARVLLEHGADPLGMMMREGRLAPPTALDSAFATNNGEMVELLLSSCTYGTRL